MTAQPEGRRLRLVFMGTPALALPTLAAVAREHDVVAVVTQPDRPVGRGKRLAASPIKEWALERSIPVLQPTSLRGDDIVASLADCAPDAIVVVAFGMLLPASILELPVLGCLNVHASLLPRHRGASPIQAAIRSGDSVTGVTTMLMDAGLDTGPILLQRELAIAPDDTAGTLGKRLGALGAELMTETLSGLEAGRVQAVAQDPLGATTTRQIRKVDGRIDWAASPEEIDRHVRSMQPWPSAFTEIVGTRTQVWRVARLEADADPAGAALPGTVVRADARLVVACSGGAVELLELQRAGGKRLPTEDFLRGFPIAVGTTLGDAPAIRAEPS